MKKSAAPIVAAVLLLLPLLYVGSYLALVVPSANTLQNIYSHTTFSGDEAIESNTYGPEYSDAYRVDSEWLARLFWPVEQIDKRLRPGAWGSRYDQTSPPSGGLLEVFDPYAIQSDG